MMNLRTCYQAACINVDPIGSVARVARPRPVPRLSGGLGGVAAYQTTYESSTGVWIRCYRCCTCYTCINVGPVGSITVESTCYLMLPRAIQVRQRRLPHGDGLATGVRVSAWDLGQGAHHRLHHGAQPAWERTSTTVDGSGPSLNVTPDQGHPIVTRTHLARPVSRSIRRHGCTSRCTRLDKCVKHARFCPWLLG